MVTFFNRIINREKIQLDGMSMKLTSYSQPNGHVCYIDFYFTQKIKQPALLNLSTGYIWITDDSCYSCSIHGTIVKFCLEYRRDERDYYVKKFIQRTSKFVSFFKILLAENITTISFLKSKIDFFNCTYASGLFEAVQEVLKPEKNTIILSKLPGFDFNTIPKRLCCSITYQIMDDPVLDLTLQDSEGNKIQSDDADEFDREEFEKWLNKHNNLSPLTQKIVPMPLLTDFKRQEEIRIFIDGEIKKYNQYTNSIPYKLKTNIECFFTALKTEISNLKNNSHPKVLKYFYTSTFIALQISVLFNAAIFIIESFRILCCQSRSIINLPETMSNGHQIARSDDELDQLLVPFIHSSDEDSDFLPDDEPDGFVMA